MAQTRLSNTADVTVSDRAVVGPQPDQTPATGGATPGGGGGGGGSITSVQGTANQVIVNGTTGSPETGAIVLTLPQDIGTTSVVTFSDVIANSSVATSIMAAARYNIPLTIQSGAGAFTINVSSQNRTLLDATGNFSITLAGIAQDIPNWIIVHNNTGAPITPTWPGWTVANGATLPAMIAAGAYVILGLQPVSTTIGSVIVEYAASSAPTPPIGTYLPTTGPIQARLRKANATPITAASDMVWTANPWFSWEDYNGVVNSSNPTDASNNVACFANAVTDAFNFAGPGGAATVFVPNGTWYVSDQLTVTFPFNCSLAVVGTGRHGSQIVQLTAGKRGIYGDLSVGTNKRNRMTVRGLGFKAASGVKLLDAVMIDYGAAAIVSSENIGGSTVEDIEIGNWSETDTGGWTWGVTMKNAWHFHVSDIYGYGGLSWDGASSPGAGDGTGGGSGALLRFQSGVNYSVSHIFADFWSQFMRIEDAGLATPVDAQGVLCEHLNCVVCMEFVHAYAGPGGSGLLVGTFTNFQCDNGNFNRAGYRGFVFEGNAGNISLTTGYLYQDGGINHLKLDKMTACTFTDVTFKSVNNNTSGPGVYATGTANANKWNGCEFVPSSGSYAIQFDASAGLSQMNNTGGATITNLGASNRFLSTLF